MHAQDVFLGDIDERDIRHRFVGKLMDLSGHQRKRQPDQADKTGDVGPVRSGRRNRKLGLKDDSAHGSRSSYGADSISKPSTERTISSIATSPAPLAESVGPVYFSGMTPRRRYFCTGFCASSRSVMTTSFLASTPVVRVSVTHPQKSSEFTRPRLRVTSPTLCAPGILRT